MCIQTVKKSVRWSTLTVYEFDVAIGGSSVPRHGGPSVGLAKKPTSVWSTSLDATCDSEGHGDVPETQSEDTSEHSPDEADDAEAVRQRRVQAMAKIRKKQQHRRRNRVRWLKPLERVTMLTQAGLSEKRICRMMKECAAICMSRRLSIRAR